MAEGIMRKKILERNLPFEVDSAGTSNYHIGENPDDRAIETAAKFGVDISRLRGRQFTARDFSDFDLIFAMDSSNYRDILRLAPGEEEKRKISHFLRNGNKDLDVPDPWFGGMEGFTSVYKLIDNACEQILNDLEVKHRQDSRL